MFRKLVNATEIEIDGTAYAGAVLRADDAARERGVSAAKCCSDAADRIILDDDSMSSLESKCRALAPATVYSRLLAARPSIVAA